MIKYFMSLACVLTLALLSSCCCDKNKSCCDISKPTEQSQPASPDANNILGVKVEEEKTEKF